MSFTVPRNLKRKLRNVLLTLIGLYVMILASISFLQEKLIFLPTPLDEDYKFEFVYPFNELFFETDKDAIINAIHFKTENPKGVILYFHGNAGNLSRWGTIVEYFVSLNYDVLIPDYRTYGKSKGPLSESAFYKDAQYCYNYLLGIYSEHDITLYGRSLGTGMASYLASKNNPSQLILETPYFSIEDIAQRRFPIFPVKQLLRYKFPNHEHLSNVTCTITILHGSNDEVVSIDSGKKLNQLNLKNLEFITIEGGRHNNLVEFEKYHTSIQRILK